MYKFSVIMTAFAVSLVLLAPTITHAEKLGWTGCGISKKAFMSEMAKTYEAKYGTVVKLSGGGATKGIRAVTAGSSEIGGSCRARLKGVGGTVHAEEKNANLVQVAWDALVVITHPNNPVDNISMDQLKQVYDGKITNWKELGGVDKRIALVVRDGKYSGVGHMFRKMVFADQEYEFKALSLKVKSTGPLENKVEKTVTAMGVDGISSAKRRNLKFLSINGVKPTKKNIASGKYSLFRPLYIVMHKSKASAEARKFVDFVLSPEGQATISRVGTVNLKEGQALKSLWAAKSRKVGL